MTIADIIRSVQSFDPSETKIIDLSGSYIKGNMLMNGIKFGNNYNNIIVLNNTICLGSVNIGIQSVPSLPLSSSEEINTNKFNKSISSISNLLQNKDNYGNPLTTSLPTGKLNNTVTLYYPLLTGDTYDQVFTANNSGNTATITSNNTFSDLATPNGRALVLIFPKTTNTQNYTISIVRDGLCLQNKTTLSCPECSSCTSEICPSCTSEICPECSSCTPEKNNGVSLLIFWIVTILLSLTIVCTALLCWLCKK
jgi:hypothetical protein